VSDPNVFHLQLNLDTGTFDAMVADMGNALHINPLTLGPPITYIPVVRRPWDDPRTCVGGGARGFVRVPDGKSCECLSKFAEETAAAEIHRGRPQRGKPRTARTAIRYGTRRAADAAGGEK